jgi:pSer/pThr/pTyr-binding forkhead associated (FHA) protein
MFKLVAVGGKLRGQSFDLGNGDNIVGRSSSSEISISVEGVSKKHFKITVNGENCYVQDLGSSNGTFVNGKLVKNSTVNNKDQIAIPNVIFQVVYVKEKLIRKEGSFKDTEMDYSLEAKE